MRSQLYKTFFVFINCLFLTSLGLSQRDVKRPVTVEDSVMLRVFTNSNYIGDGGGGHTAISPDGRRLVYALRETNLEKNVNEVVLYVLDVPAKIGEPLPALGKGREVFRSPAFASPSVVRSDGATRTRSNQFRWLADNRTLLVLHEPEGEKYPVISRVNVDKAKSMVVFRPRIEVTEFAADETGDRIAVAGRIATSPGPVQSSRGVVVTNETADPDALEEEYWSGRGYMHESQLRLRREGDREVVLFRTKANRFSDGRESISNVQISPDGSRLIFTTDAAGIKVPEAWLADPQTARIKARSLIINLETALAGNASNSKIEHQLAFDAPAAAINVKWSNDSSAYLFRGPTPVGAARGGAVPSGQKLWAVDARTRATSLVLADASELHQIVAFDSGAARAVVRMTGGELITYGRRAGNPAGDWKEETRVKPNIGARPDKPHVSFDAPFSFAANDRIVVQVEQGLSTPPDLWVTEIATQRRTRLTEVNPEIKEQRLSKIETIHIQGTYGKTYWGHVVYPTDYVPGRRYPTVILMKSWRKDGFIHTAQNYYNEFPPLQLSAAGMAVLMLQTTNALSGGELPAEIRSQRTEVRAAFEETDSIRVAKRHLVKQGLTDPDRVGLMSFSHTVRYMKYALTQQKEADKRPEWAAAIGTDVADADYVTYLRHPNIRGFGQGKYGGPPFGKSRAAWEKYSAPYHADKVRTPVISQFHTTSIYDDEWVGALRLQGKPVEWIWLPDAGHLMQPPQARQAGMHIAVDWMRFWLQDYEGNAPDHDPNRFVRWRKMRQQHQWNEKLIAEGKDPAQEYMDLRAAGKEPKFDDDAKSAASVQKVP